MSHFLTGFLQDDHGAFDQLQARATIRAEFVELFAFFPVGKQVRPLAAGAGLFAPILRKIAEFLTRPEVAAAGARVVFHRKRGCPRCDQTGYKGRTGIYQLLSMTEDLATLAAGKASRQEIERAAFASGMSTLWDDGLAKIMAGMTSLEELARVTS